MEALGGKFNFLVISVLFYGIKMFETYQGTHNTSDKDAVWVKDGVFSQMGSWLVCGLVGG
jgi:hypothetical protein